MNKKFYMLLSALVTLVLVSGLAAAWQTTGAFQEAPPEDMPGSDQHSLASSRER